MEKIFIVGIGASFVHGGRLYKEGEEINGGLFKDADLQVLTKSKKLLTAEEAKSAFAKNKEPSPAASPAASSPSGNNQKQLDDMNLEELKAYAAEKKITVSGNKADILAAIKTAEAENKAAQ